MAGFEFVSGGEVEALGLLAGTRSGVDRQGDAEHEAGSAQALNRDDQRLNHGLGLLAFSRWLRGSILNKASNRPGLARFWVTNNTLINNTYITRPIGPGWTPGP